MLPFVNEKENNKNITSISGY